MNELIFDVELPQPSRKIKKKYQNNPKKIEKIINVIEDIAKKRSRGDTRKICRPHYLSGQYSGCLECHIEGDLLIIWIQNDGEKVIYLMRLGSHSELFS